MRKLESGLEIGRMVLPSRMLRVIVKAEGAGFTGVDSPVGLQHAALAQRAAEG
jgi:hypothetical protein